MKKFKLVSLFEKMRINDKVSKVSFHLDNVNKISKTLFDTELIIKELKKAKDKTECEKCSIIIKQFIDDLKKIKKACKNHNNIECEIAKYNLINKINEFKHKKLRKYTEKKIQLKQSESLKNIKIKN